MYQDLNIISKLYSNSPNMVKDCFFTIHGLIKMGQHKNIVKKHLQNLMRTQYNPALVKKIQEQKFRKLVNHCFLNVPYYKIYFEKNGIQREAINGLEDITYFPIISKELLLDNYGKFISTNYKKFSPIKRETGGSTGLSLTFLMDKSNLLQREAELLRFFTWHSYSPSDSRTAILRGNVLFSRLMNESDLIRHDKLRNIIYMSSYNLDDISLEYYYQKIKNLNINFLRAYPSSAYLFAKFINKHNLSLNLRAVFTSSETLLPEFRLEIEKAFKCSVVDSYGHSEPGCYAVGQCSEGNYVIPSENVFLELSDTGSMIETALNNFSMPFIRYEIGDLAESMGNECKCGIKLPCLRKLKGRKDDILKIHGRSIPPAGLNQIFKGVNVKIGQIRQTSDTDIRLDIVPIKNKKPNLKKLGDKLRERIGFDSHISIRIVNQISKSSIGKYRLVVRDF